MTPPATTPHVITLGTAGGPKIWTKGQQRPRCGIATAVVVGERWYLVDAGHGAFTQIKRAGLSVENLAGIFITHLHSDHVIDLNSVAVLGMFDLVRELPRIPIYGPGDRGVLPPVSPRAAVPPSPVFPQDPTPGMSSLFRSLMHAHATDLNDRVLDALRPSPCDVFEARDIELPADIGYHPNDSPSPEMDPFVVHEDDEVRVTATLVVHPPIAPAFAFRFQTSQGSVTISGDTRPSENLIRLARDTDLLLHEAIDFQWVASVYSGDDELSRASADHHRKSHTSPEDAGRIAAAAGARQLALHHLVPGNSPERAWREAERSFGRQVHIPKDLETIAFGAVSSHTAPAVQSV
ncbi:MBL fold metallo-hydrolase [Kocuria flava]|uniref:MBL fold metallo-hydrolase n=1 Tax=Kocuria flava TaxID=446860 RepID=UPI001FF36EEF|nr:MBL fold metallo-hydrolase [Kocuria flava]MCJ8503975.1 MBL fold metallo-hydrolase [Kocuria flava]